MPDEKQTRENQEQIRAESSILLQINRPTPTLPPPKPRIIPAFLDFSPPSALVFFAFAAVMARVMVILFPVVMILRRSVIVIVSGGLGVDVDVESRTPVPLKHSALSHYTSSYALATIFLLCLVHSTDVPAECSFKPGLPPHPRHFPLPLPPHPC